MAKKLFIAEKPSVAQEFAKALKYQMSRRDGYLESEEAIVTWCVGHLVTMSYPEVYDIKYKKWSVDTLPFIPETFKYEVISSVKKQFDIVSSLLNRPDVDTIYVCTDSGREGEYIYRLVEQEANIHGKKRRRVWIDSQTEEEILRGVREAKDLSEYDNLANAAYLRAKEDYLMGINFSRALTLKYGNHVKNYLRRDRAVISVGRVMTCVLGMVVNREREIRSFVKTPFYRVTGAFGIPMGDGKEKPFELLQDVFDEVAPLFPGEYIHIGGDECPKSSWKECPLCQKRIREEGLKADKSHSAEEKLQSYFVQRMEKYLSEKHGKKIIGWDEILEGGLAPSATVMSWRGEEGGIAAANMGHEAIMTPGSGGMYIDQFQGDPKIEPVSIGGYDPLSRVYAYNPIPDTLVATGKANLIKGVQTNLWSEYMYNTDLLEYRAYPRVLALAEIGWTPLARKDYKDFERRLDNALVRLDELNINYHIPQPEQPNGSCDFVAFTDKASLEFKTTRPVKVVYTIDGTEPTPESTAYSAPIEFTESGVLKIRSVLPSGKMSKTRTITVEKQALAPAKEVAKTTPGLEMQVTDGMFLNSSKLGDVKEWKKSVIKDLREITSVVKSSESMRGVKQYAAIATGYVNIPEDGVYYISSDNEEVWIDGKLLVNNAGEVKRFSRHDSSAALSKGLHEIKVVFLGHIIGGWPSNWNDGSVKLRKADSDKFVKITPEMLVH